MSTFDTTSTYSVTTKSGLTVELPNFTSIPFDILEVWTNPETNGKENAFKNLAMFKAIPEFAQLTKVCGMLELNDIIEGWMKAVGTPEELGK
jgi:hypothetical protein